MTSKNTSRQDKRTLLAGASVLAAAAAAMSAAPAQAQEADFAEEEAIVVTGTRLVRQDSRAISPVTTVGAEQLELTATLTTDSLLNELPQIVPGNTRTSNNAGGEDFATVDLRGLGPRRTLVLVNGERVPVSSTSGAVDLNTIPASLISRIEVVTGGASAVYGSDAMAGVVNFVLISADHPDLWAALQSRPDPTAPFVMDRRFNEVGTRNQHLENTSIFFLSGLEGALGENWDWNLPASYGQVLFNMRNTNSVNRTALGQGLAGCQDLAGNPLGQSALPGCVALDIFGENTLTPEMVDFIRVNTFTDVQIEESRITGFVRGDLFDLPAGPAAAVFGFEYRDTYAGQFNDNEQRTGNIYGFNAIQDQEGQIDVYELYTEFAVPLISEAPFAHYLGLEAGYRRSNYSTIGDVDTYKIGARFQP